MVALKVNGVRTKCPDRWSSVTTGQFQRMVTDWQPDKPIEKRDRILLFSILTGSDYTGIASSKDSELEYLLHTLTDFVYQESIDFSKLPIPQALNIGDHYVTIPRELGKLTIGQSVHARIAMNSGKDPNSLISLISAIYLQPLYDQGEFSYDRALVLEQRLLQLPIVKLYPIGFFFLNRLATYGRGWWHRLRRMIRQRIASGLSSLNLLTFPDSTSILKHP